MTLTAAYASDLSRVRLSFSGAPSTADYALIERSVDQITWTTVRGGSTVTITAGAGHLDDYEFSPGQINYYRASYVDTATMTISAATVATGNNASLSPAIPAGVIPGDLLVLVASIRSSGTGTVTTPAGWTSMLVSGNVKIMGRRYVSGDPAPTVTFAGGAAGDSTTAQIFFVRNAELIPAVTNAQLNASAQNIAYPGASTTYSALWLLTMWKQAQPSTISAVTGYDIGVVTAVNNTQGSGDSTQIWAMAYPNTVPSGTATVTGGAAAISRALVAGLRKADYVNRDTTSITPTLTQTWIKNLVRPYANTAISNPVGLLSIERKARAGLFDIVGRQLPVAVTDLRAGKAYTLGAQVTDAAERTRLDLILSAGNTVYLQYPPSVRLSPIYAVIGDIAYDDETSTYSLPLTEVAAPASTVVGATVLWSDIVATYATWADLVTAKATWADVLDMIGSPMNIITG